MNRNRQRDNRLMRDNRGGRGNFGIGGDGLLGEGPPSGGPGPMMGGNALGLRDTQLALAQSLLQQQQLMNSGFGGAGGGDFGGLGALAGGMHFLQQQQNQMRMPLGGGGGGGGGMGMGGGMRGDRKRSGGQLRRDNDEKRGRRDSWGRGERDRSHGSSNRSGQDRDRNRRDADKEKKKQGEDYDPAEPTEDDVSEELNKDKDKDSNLYCHVCSVSVYDEESFQRHLNGLKHKSRMESIASVHSVRNNQMNFRLKAEEHLRNIERKGGRDPDYFCKICNNDLAIPWEKHRYSNIHKQRLLQVRKGCGWCKVHDFTNFTEVLEHRETDEHKKNADLFGKKDDEKDDSRTRIKDGKERSKTEKGKDNIVEEEEEEEEDLTIPEYNAENPVGLDYVIPVTGYFCKLCHKFYNKKSARATHCQSTMHYEKFKEATEAKIAAREKKREEDRLRKEKEAEEAEEAMEEDNEGVEVKEEIESDTGDIKKEMGGEEQQVNNGGAGEEEEGVDNSNNKDDAGGMEDDEAMLDDGGEEGREEEDEDDQQDLSGSMDAGVGVGGTVESSSFMYVPGDQVQQQQQQQGLEGEDGGGDQPGQEAADDSMADAVTTELSQTSLNPEEVDNDLDLSVPDEEAAAAVVPATSTPVVVVVADEEEAVAEQPKTATRSKATAKRGRGRGRAKK